MRGDAHAHPGWPFRGCKLVHQRPAEFHRGATDRVRNQTHLPPFLPPLGNPCHRREIGMLADGRAFAGSGPPRGRCPRISILEYKLPALYDSTNPWAGNTAWPQHDLPPADKPAGRQPYTPSQASVARSVQQPRRRHPRFLSVGRESPRFPKHGRTLLNPSGRLPLSPGLCFPHDPATRSMVVGLMRLMERNEADS